MRWPVLVLVAGCVGASELDGVPVDPVSPSSSEDWTVAVYDEAGFSGSVLLLGKGSTSLEPLSWAGRVRSVRIQNPSCEVSLRDFVEGHTGDPSIAVTFPGIEDLEAVQDGDGDWVDRIEGVWATCLRGG